MCVCVCVCVRVCTWQLCLALSLLIRSPFVVVHPPLLSYWYCLSNTAVVDVSHRNRPLQHLPSVIEATLRTHPAVGAAAVVAHSQPDSGLHPGPCLAPSPPPFRAEERGSGVAVGGCAPSNVDATASAGGNGRASSTATTTTTTTTTWPTKACAFVVPRPSSPRGAPPAGVVDLDQVLQAWVTNSSSSRQASSSGAGYAFTHIIVVRSLPHTCVGHLQLRGLRAALPFLAQPKGCEPGVATPRGSSKAPPLVSVQSPRSQQMANSAGVPALPTPHAPSATPTRVRPLSLVCHL